jgi:hypothetical protein
VLAITMIAINCVIPESLESFPILFKMNSKSHVSFTSVLPAFTLLGGDNNYVALPCRIDIYILCHAPPIPTS